MYIMYKSSHANAENANPNAFKPLYRSHADAALCKYSKQVQSRRIVDYNAAKGVSWPVIKKNGEEDVWAEVVVYQTLVAVADGLMALPVP